MLTIHPHSGIQFVKPGLELTRSTYQFRGIIEAAAVAVYAETATDARDFRRCTSATRTWRSRWSATG